MPDFGRWNANGGDPSLSDINRSDQFLDALASGGPVYAADQGEVRAAGQAVLDASNLKESDRADCEILQNKIIPAQCSLVDPCVFHLKRKQFLYRHWAEGNERISLQVPI